LIIFDHVVFEDIVGRKHVLSFHIPFPSLTLMIVPSVFDKFKLAKLILGYEKPLDGNIVYESIDMKTIDKKIYFPEAFQQPNIKIVKFLDMYLKPRDASHIIDVFRNMGLTIHGDTVLSDLPKPFRNLFGICFTLYKSRGLTILIEPFDELDNQLIMSLSYEIKLRKSDKQSFIIVVSNRSYIDTLDYDYVVEITSSGEIFEGDLERFKGEDIFRNTSIYELVGDHKAIQQLVNAYGFKGYVQRGRNIYWILIDQGKVYRSLTHLINDLRRKGLIKRIRRIERGGD